MPKLFDMEIDSLTLDEAVDAVRGWVFDSDSAEPCRYVVTPNVDHAVLYARLRDLRDAYEGASLTLADGAPLVVASRLFGCRLPERVAGSDLVPALFDAASEATGSIANTGCDGQNTPAMSASHLGEEPNTATSNLTVFLLGAAPGVADQAAAAIHARWSGVEVVGTYSPPVGFENDPEENEAILARIAAVRPDVLLVGLGAPKQELWVARHHDRLTARVALCVGATIDFLAGHRRRAPRWMRRSGLEWLHRMLSEPRRLTRRYLHDALALPGLCYRQWRAIVTSSRQPAP